MKRKHKKKQISQKQTVQKPKKAFTKAQTLQLTTPYVHKDLTKTIGIAICIIIIELVVYWILRK